MAAGIAGLKAKAGKKNNLLEKSSVNEIIETRNPVVENKAANNYAKQQEEQERLEYMNVKEARDKKYALEQELDSLRKETGGTTSIVSSALSNRGKNIETPDRANVDRINALQQEIDSLGRDINLASRIQQNKYLTDRAVNAEDFGEFSSKGAGIINPSYKEATGLFGKEIANPVSFGREHWQAIEASNKAGGAGNKEISDSSLYRYMKDEEVEIYNYYLGKAGKEKAQEYLESIAEDLNKRKAEEVYSTVKDKGLLEIAYRTGADIEGTARGFQGAVDMLMGKTDYKPTSAIQYASQMANEGLADFGPKIGFLGDRSLGQITADALGTTAAMAPSIAIGTLTGTGMAATVASAAGNAYQEKINEGYSKDQARAYGTIIGASEYALGKVVGAIGYGGETLASKAFSKLIPKINSVGARIAYTYGTKALSEGAEESLQEYLEPIYRNIALGESNEAEFTTDVLYVGILGALSGGLIEGTPYAMNEISTAINNRKTDKVEPSSEPIKEAQGKPENVVEAVNETVQDDKKVSETSTVEEDLKNLAKEVVEEKAKEISEKEPTASVTNKEGRYVQTISKEGLEEYGSKLPNATEDTGKQVAAMYDIKDGVSKETFIKGVDEAYRYGSMNFSLEEMDRGGSFAKDIPSEKKLQAYYMGQRNAETATIVKANEQQKKALSGVKGKVVFEGNAATKIKNDQQRSTIRFINSVLKNASSMEYHIFASYEEDGKRVYKNSKGKVVPAPNGFYDPKNHQIWIDINAGEKGQGIMLYTLTHEHVHDIKVWSAEHYNELVKITSQAFEHAGKSFKEAVDVKYAQYKKSHPDTTYEDAQEEVVAEAMSGLLSDEKALREFSEQIQKQDKSLWNRIKAWFNDIVARITAAYKGVEPESEEAKILMEQKELFEHAQKVFAEAVVEAGGNYKNSGAQSSNSQVKNADTNAKFQDRDSAYMNAVNKGDMKTAQKLVDEAAKEAGYDSPMLYHGTGAFGFTEFDLSKMDDRRSIFLTDSERIASTYSGVEGKREIGKKEKTTENLSVEELAKELNRYPGESEMQFTYDTWNFEKQNKLIQDVNEGIDKLKSQVGKQIEVYAEKLAKDFAEGDYKTHSQLVKLEENLENYRYKELSTPIYLLLHMTDVFNENAEEIAEFERNIRLLNKFEDEAVRGNYEVIVQSGLDGYSIDLLTPEYAKGLLETNKGRGNYSLYADLGRSLEINAEGQVWNHIQNWWRALRVTDRNTYVKKTDKEFQLIRKEDGNVVEGGKLEINDNNKDLTEAQIQYHLVGKANNTLSILAENAHTTRDISAWAKNWGYNSVVFKGLKDNGGRNYDVDIDETANIYIIFDPNRAKSADPVTYDNEGNFIPLSERFKENNPDIRYSLRKKVASFNPKSYNGIRLPGEEYARLSHAVGTYQPQVRGYTSQILDNENGDPAICYQVFVEKSGRLIVLDKYPATNIHEKEDYFDAYIKREEFDRSDSGRGFEQRRDDFSNFGSERRTDAGSDKIFERGNSSSTQSDDRDDVENLSDNAERKWRDFVDYFFEDGKQFYQDRLSNADKNRLEILSNKTNRISSDLKTLEKAFGKLVKDEFEKNIAPNEGLSKRAKAINEKAAKRFMNEVGAMFAVPKKTREEYLLPIINEIIDKGPAKSESEGLIEKLYNTAYDHTEDYIVDTDPDGAYKNLRNYIRKTPLFVDNGTKADVGDYNTFRKANMGSLSLTSDAKAIPLDGFYDEVSKIAPEVFSGTIDGAEQLYELSSFMKDRGRTESIGDFMPKEEYVSWADESLGAELQNLYDVTIGNFLNEATRKETERTRAAEVKDAMESVKSAAKTAKEEGILIGQIEQGRTMAKEMRQKQATFDRKAKGYENAIAKKKEQISEVRRQKNELLAKAKAERAEAVERVRKADRERMEKAIADIKATERAKFNAAKERSDEQKRAIIEKYQTSIKKATEGRHRTDIRGKIKRVVNELNTLLTKQTKEKHVPLELQKPVAAALDILNLDDPRYYNSRIKNLEARIAEAKSSEERHLLEEELNKVLDQRTAFKDKIEGLKKAYESIKDSADPYIALGYNENIAGMIDRVAKDIGDTYLRDMSMNQLEGVYDLYKAVLKTVRDANKLFAEEKGASVVESGLKAIEEVEQSGKAIDEISKGKLDRKKFFWNNLKPVYAFKKLGSKTLENLFGGILKGQGTWAKDVSEAKDFFERTRNKYGYKKWDFKKKFDFVSNTGKAFSLNLQQMMSLYAYSKRDQAYKHLTDGGFVFDNKETVRRKGREYVVNTSQAFNISVDALQDIIGKLSTEQRMFVDEMQKYLSETMGEKGNEVSRAMYDIELFREAENYFPLKSAKQFLHDRNEVTNETRQLVNSGFTKPIQPGANNPIILTGFMDVWANHVNDMSMYHAFVMPIEDFNKVYNFQFGRGEDYDSKSVKSTIQSRFTEAANQYIEQLLKDINGGARVDSREGWYKTMLARWKKAKVMGSLSVVVQQPSAIGRAYAEVDFKYFVNPKKISKPNKERAWEQLKKYAPVAIIKEMGYFDTDMGQSTAEFIKGEKTLMDKIDAAFGWMPAKADEITWVAIWDAVKRETKAKHKDLNVNSDEFLKIAGERFTEVIDKTQVYDSVLSRSGYMRSKSSMVQTLVSFMAEPTTSANMVRQAISEFKAGNNKKGRAYIASVGVSLLFNSVLSSFIYAMRDDDEDERYYEKYIEAFAKELVDSINPLTYSPIVKDFWSILQGFGIDRPDMDLVNDLYDSIDKTIGNIKDLVEGINDGTLSKEEIKEGFKEVGEEAWSALDELLFMSGIAAGNIHRDVEAIIKTIGGAKKGIKGSDEYLEHSQRFIHDKITDAVVGQLPWNKHYIESRDNKLLDGMVSGDKVYLERLKKGYSSEDAYNNAVKAVIKNGYASKKLSLEKAKQLLVKYHGEDITEAEALLRTLDFKKAYADTSLSDNQIKNYYLPIAIKNSDQLLKSPYEYGIPEKTYSEYIMLKAECKGVDKNNDGKADSGSVKKEVMKVIDNLNLTKEQKDALYYDNGWAKGTLHEAPWR